MDHAYVRKIINMNVFSEKQTIFQWGEVNYLNGGRYGPRSDPYLSLYQIFKGKMEIIINNDVFLTNAGETVLVCNEKEVDYQFGVKVYLAWCEILKPPIPTKIYNKIKDSPIVLKTSSRLAQLMELGLQVNRKGIHKPTEFKNALGRAFIHEFFDQAKLELSEESLPELVERVINYIEQHYTEECNAQSIAEYAGVSRRYLFNLFKGHLEISPADYLWQLRLIKGVHLLCHSGLRISEIAYQCGFKNPYHFSRYVKQHHGVSPNKLRKMHSSTFS